MSYGRLLAFGNDDAAATGWLSHVLSSAGVESAAQIMAFGDAWQWSQEEEAVYREIVESGPRKLADLMQALLGRSPLDEEFQ